MDLSTGIMGTIKDNIPYLHDTDTWIIQVFLIIFFALLFDFIQRKVFRRLKRQLEKTANLWDDAFAHAAIRPVSLLIWMFGLSIALQIAGWDHAVKLFEVGLIVVIGWTLIRFIGFVEENIIHEQEIRGKTVDKTTASAVSQLLRVSVLITSLLVALQSLGFNISAILAFGGIGGIAVGFAAKDLLANCSVMTKVVR